MSKPNCFSSFCDEFRIETLGAAIARVASSPPIELAEIVAAAGQAGRRCRLAGELGDHLLDRAAGRELDDGEGNAP